MKKLLFSTIKYGTVVGLGLGALVHTAFAAAVITPVTVTEIGRTEAVVQAKVDNLGMYRATVWFEWGETSALEKPVAGMKDISVSGYLEHRFIGLKELTPYYVRAAVMDSRGNAVYSPVTTFTTGDIITPAPVVKRQEPVEQAVVMPTITKKKTDTASPAKKETSGNSTNVKKETPVKKTAATTTAASSTQGALLLGVGGEAFPQTLIGWLVLFIVILVIVILVHMIYDTNQKRKQALEKAAQEAKTKAEMQE